LETVASGSTILRYGRNAVTRHPHSALSEMAHGDPERVTGEMVTLAARQGDPASQGILVEVGHRLGEGIAGLVNVLDPEIVVVGGGASTAGDLLLGPVRKAYRMTVEAYDRRPDVPIVPAQMGNDAGGVGAALLALEALP
jgi:glucokinase